MTQKVKRPIDEGDWNMAFLFPDEIAAARARTGLVILPLAPLEWHGPHLTMGCDNLLAHAFARRLARELAMITQRPTIGSLRKSGMGAVRVGKMKYGIDD